MDGVSYPHSFFASLAQKELYTLGRTFLFVEESDKI